MKSKVAFAKGRATASQINRRGADWPDGVTRRARYESVVTNVRQ